MSDIAKRKVDSVRVLLERSKGQIADALPKHLTPERMIRIAMTAVQRAPELLECSPLSIVASVVLASQLGLELDSTLGHAYLVPFWNSKSRQLEAQMIVGYKGYLALARRSGEVSTFRPAIAYANEHFQWTEGTDCHIVHRPILKGRGEPVAVYAVLKLRDGSHDFEVLPWDAVLECQQQNGHYQQGKKKGEKKPGPWWTHLEEMAKKTAIRRLAKRCPVSVDVQKAASLDEMAEAGVPQPSPLNLSRTDVVAAQLEAIADPPADDEDAAEREAIQAEGAQTPA